ncbi:MAG: hypothetical protein CMI66_05965 [Pedosphaera sp.]|nr:hypothetical protein [Pedosphaera sp.]HCP37106.1 hypothetical protein [Verrucomicrobiales bacterium]HCZ05247.1 hypothetical protein [Verrucomicrobiales bacterium]
MGSYCSNQSTQSIEVMGNLTVKTLFLKPDSKPIQRFIKYQACSNTDQYIGPQPDCESGRICQPNSVASP